MDFLSKLLQGISFVPTIVAAVESLFAGHPGAEKKGAAVSFLESAISITDAVMSRQIVDETKFREGLGKVIDGVVECLNASAWAKPSTPSTPKA